MGGPITANGNPPWVGSTLLGTMPRRSTRRRDPLSRGGCIIQLPRIVIGALAARTLAAAARALVEDGDVELTDHSAGW